MIVYATDPTANQNIQCLLESKGKHRSLSKEAVTASLKKIKVTEDNKKQLTTLFFQTLYSVDYDRGEGINAEVEELLCPELKSARTEYERKVIEVKFAQKLGVEFERIGTGVNGSYFGLDRFRHKLVVFKPADEELGSEGVSKLSSRIYNFLLRLFPSINPFRNIAPHQAYLNEAAASSVDAFLGFNIVPVTHVETFTAQSFAGKVKEKSGSCQLFIAQARSAKSVYRIPDFVPVIYHKAYTRLLRFWRYPVISKDSFEKFVILDFVIGNQDRHFENFLIKGKKVFAIDNGFAFPSKKPTGIGTINQYAWANLPEARRSFSSHAAKYVQKLACERESLYALLRSEMGDKFTEAQRKEMDERIDILLKVINMKKTPHFLGKIKTERNFQLARQALGFRYQPKSRAKAAAAAAKAGVPFGISCKSISLCKQS